MTNQHDKPDKLPGIRNRIEYFQRFAAKGEHDDGNWQTMIDDCSKLLSMVDDRDKHIAELDAEHRAHMDLAWDLIQLRDKKIAELESALRDAPNPDNHYARPEVMVPSWYGWWHNQRKQALKGEDND